MMKAPVKSDYDSQGMALKLKEHDEALHKYTTFEYPCEANLTWCCGGNTERSGKNCPYTIATEGIRRGMTCFDANGVCSRKAVFRVLLLDHLYFYSREERLSKELARPMQPTLCEECTQIAIDERIFREIISTKKADQMEQDFQKQMEAENKKKAAQKKSSA